jgi:hypothetical protein
MVCFARLSKINVEANLLREKKRICE